MNVDMTLGIVINIVAIINIILKIKGWILNFEANWLQTPNITFSRRLKMLLLILLSFKFPTRKTFRFLPVFKGGFWTPLLIFQMCQT